jgi:hypothetical protein
MHYGFTFLICCFLFSCKGPETPEASVARTVLPTPGNYVWTKITDSADWRKSYNYQAFSLRDTLWIFHPSGTWFSVDGKYYAKSRLPNVLNNMAFLDYVVFSEAFYGLGYFEGNIEQFQFKPSIYRSRDAKTWELLEERSNLPARFFYHPFVFKDKLWIIGGEDKARQYADIWTSTDAIHWTKEKDSLAFGKTSNVQIVQLKNRLYLLGNDVWSSLDGLDWRQETKEIVRGQRLFGYTALVYDEKIWLFGCNRNDQFTSNVLVSANGVDWAEMNAPWSPRGGIVAAVHKDKVFITGGKYGGQDIQHPEFVYSNDIWMLEKK